MRLKSVMLWAAAAVLGLGTVPAAAQVQTIDPNSAIDADLNDPQPQSTPTPSATPDPYYQQDQYQQVPAEPPASVDPAVNPYAAPPATPQNGQPTLDANRIETRDTYARDDLIGAAEGVFGRGAEGLAGIIENILREQGEPNAYIAGREAGGAFIVGLRYGSGTLFHRVEGQRPVYWTGPSVGFDVGGDANKVFVLVYNLYDSQELYKRFPAGEGRAYFVGGFSAAYLRSGDTVLIPVRLGVGWRLGANVGYMKFSEEQRWLPF
ncbi:DUF1134 domain-containing protein [Sphingosinithalassobacter sp. LHW66-3]|uniref:DUF1134 domain-containing protein n=1 Tax=Sphingosinithalassobacter sp. LHW66-3 TaxID=3424718 RepID=UPI003D6C375C